MILQLPREMLWTDYKTMDQFYELGYRGLDSVSLIDQNTFY